MIKTGLNALDQFLGGGIKEGLITSISGQSATGKTQLVFQICLNALHDEKDILFQDTDYFLNIRMRKDLLCYQ